MQARYSVETLGTAHPVTQHHYPAVMALVGKAKYIYIYIAPC